MTEDEKVRWHHQLNGCEFGWTLGVGDGQGGLACWGSWGHKELDMTERLKCYSNNIFLKYKLQSQPDQVLGNYITLSFFFYKMVMTMSLFTSWGYCEDCEKNTHT